MVYSGCEICRVQYDPGEDVLETESFNMCDESGLLVWQELEFDVSPRTRLLWTYGDLS